MLVRTGTHVSHDLFQARRIQVVAGVVGSGADDLRMCNCSGPVSVDKRGLENMCLVEISARLLGAVCSCGTGVQDVCVVGT